MSSIIIAPSGQENKTVHRRKKKSTNALSRREKAAVGAIVDKRLAKELELKKFDKVLNLAIGTDWTATGTFPLTEVTQGDSASSRDGDHVTPKSLFLRYEVRAADATNAIRVIIWRQNLNSATVGPRLLNIMQYTTTVATDIYSPYIVHSEFAKFKILSDKNYVLTQGTDNQVIIEEMYFDLSRQPQLNFNQGANTGEYQYFISFLNDSGAITHPSLKGWSRFRYTDA